MNDTYKFTCGKCGCEWLSSDYNEDDEATTGYAQGLECPDCGEGEDISGEEV